MRVIGATILGIIFGVLGMVGLYVYLVENGNIDPSSTIGVAFPLAGVVLGFLAGAFGGRRGKEPV